MFEKNGDTWGRGEYGKKKKREIKGRVRVAKGGFNRQIQNWGPALRKTCCKSVWCGYISKKGRFQGIKESQEEMGTGGKPVPQGINGKSPLEFGRKIPVLIAKKNQGPWPNHQGVWEKKKRL